MVQTTLIFCAFALALGAAAWAAWAQRERERLRAERNEQLARLGQQADDLAHDLAALMTAVQVDLYLVETLDDAQRQRAVHAAQQAVDSASRLLQEMRQMAGQAREPRSAEPIVRNSVELAERFGIPVELRVGEPLMFVGSEGAAMSVINNLITNAIREASGVDEGSVQVALDGEIRVSNPVSDPSVLSQNIYDRRVSFSGSTGSGLAIARERAAEIGWELSHQVAGNIVTFCVSPRAND